MKSLKLDPPQSVVLQDIFIRPTKFIHDTIQYTDQKYCSYFAKNKIPSSQGVFVSCLADKSDDRVARQGHSPYLI